MIEPVRFLFSENIIVYLQNLGSPFFDLLFLAITSAGSQPVYYLIAMLIFWCYGKKTGIQLMYVLFFLSFLAIFAKNLFGMPRPPDYLHKTLAQGFGFPSGHALASAGFLGFLGGRVRNTWVIITCATVVLAVSLSRVYLGVHYAGDVVGGILFGLVIALIALEVETGVLKLLQRLDRRSRYLVAVMLPLVLIAMATAQRGLLREQVETGMVMAGVGAGYLIEEDRIRFEDAKNNKQRFGRFLAGTLTLAIVYVGASLIFSDFIIFKYAALGLVSTCIAPWIFTWMETDVVKTMNKK